MAGKGKDRNSPNAGDPDDRGTGASVDVVRAVGNSVHKARSRSRQAAQSDDSTAARPTARSGAVDPNSIRPTRRRAAHPETVPAVDNDSARLTATRKKIPTKSAPELPSTAVAATGPSNARVDQEIVPVQVRERFVQVGRKYYFPDGARAFTDRINRLTTPSENSEVIRSLVTIAKAREWDEITVRGTERFRREAWSAATAAGLAVRGYRPTEFDQSRLVRALHDQKALPEGPNKRASPAVIAPQKPDENSPRLDRAARRATQELLVGRLIDHGRATYRHDPQQAMSYFVKLETQRGERVIWGVDLERAFKESLTQPQSGDAVGLRAARQEPVQVKSTQRDASGQVIGERDLQTHRNRWIVEKIDLFDARAAAARTVLDTSIDPKQAVKTHPELAGTYLQVRAAELVAQKFRDPEDRQKFVSQVRSALAESVVRGEPLPPVRLRERSAARPDPKVRANRDREPAAVRG